MCFAHFQKILIAVGIQSNAGRQLIFFLEILIIGGSPKALLNGKCFSIFPKILTVSGYRIVNSCKGRSNDGFIFTTQIFQVTVFKEFSISFRITVNRSKTCISQRICNGLYRNGTHYHTCLILFKLCNCLLSYIRHPNIARKYSDF